MVKKAKKAKKKKGRPTSYKPEFTKIAGKLCQEKGYTDKNLAAHFKVSETTINNWKNEFPEFLESIKKGKDDFDSQVVEQSLLKRAVGYSYVETTRELQDETEGIFDEEDVSSIQTLAVTKKVTKQVAPDVTAQIFWLKNRKPQRWSDKKEIDHRIEGITEPLTEEQLLERLRKIKEAGTGIDTKSIEGNGNGGPDKKTNP